ncbi:MAG: hypothetical protein MPW15_10155 [Candidatus Manganitrophus sp.]|nr:hypothetical protein [Candidatus Manganitrophus sp.]
MASDALIRKAIQDELTEIREKYADDRRTEILPEAGEIHIEDLIAPEEMVITVTHTGYIKRTPSSVYRSQRRGGKGKSAPALKKRTSSNISSPPRRMITFSSSPMPGVSTG